MAKLFNAPTEAVALRSMCSKDPKVSGALLARLSDEHFHTDEGQEVHTRIRNYFNKKGNVPAFKLLCEDIGLSEDARDFLRSADGVAKNTGQVDQLFDNLNRYRQTRLYYRLTKSIMKHLEQPKVDPEEMNNMIGEVLARAQLRRSEAAQIVNIGRDSNLREILTEVLYGENNDNCIPTGFKTFDRPNGGFFRGSLVTIGGTSGGGKSVVANQLAFNQASFGYKSTLVPLEMSIDEMISRGASTASGFSSIDIFLKKLADDERDTIWRRYMKKDRAIRNAGGRMTLFKPKEDMSIEELMNALHSIKTDVIYIDYITLLKGADGDDQWRKLGQIARFGKIHAESYNKVVVMLAQINEEGKLRYSQAVKEHSSLAWTFVATKESKEKGYLNIEMLKSRNQVDRPFTLRIEYDKMRVRDLDESELQKMAGEERKDRKSKKSSKSRDGKADDYTPKNLTE